MELLKYYQIDDFYSRDEDSIEIYGKDIINQYFCIKIEKKYGEELKVQHHFDKNIQVIYNKRTRRYLNKIGSDMDFYGKYKKYMDMKTYILIHTMIMNAINMHNSSK